ncbi:unnamed protein product [Psylliodes chrysocephalus]|uniref:Uncharacterized protein n=1 Tax=Psylliodes chrysocephalus TaxID=3402493 RepID=A0A9P0D4F8_9CUCU|nr:unnamed protein product [Psylliodes chrysocephala]
MKYILVAVLVAIFSIETECISDAEISLMMKIDQDCMPKSGATKEMSQRAMVGDFPDDPVYKKHMLCMTTAMGFFDEAGNYDMDRIHKELDSRIADPAKISEILSKCLVEKGSAEEKAFESGKCFYSFRDVL